MKYDVFISYSNKDEAIANDVCHVLEDGGFKCWIAPRNIQPGKQYAREIINGINSSSMLLLIFTSNSNESEHVINEVDRAFNAKKTIVPFLAENVVMNEELDYYLARKQWFVAYPRYSSRLGELITTLAEILQKPVTGKNRQQVETRDEAVEESVSTGLWQKVKKTGEVIRDSIGKASSTAEALLNYEKGTYFDDKGEYEEAVKWYRKAAEQGDANAQCNLGNCYFNGTGVPQSYSDAVKWYRKAAEQGDTDAQCWLGICYYNGHGVPQSYSDAVKWYSKSAEQGNAAAQCNLGICYESGLGVSCSKSEAAKWYRKAAEQGQQDAKDALKRLGY